MIKQFVYLIQSEAKIPKELDKLKNKNSDVVVLTWKKPVKNCIFFPFSTWTQGRNRLLQEVIDKDYLYYIFLDEDIVLTKTKRSKSKKNPWRLFEDLLLEYKPAVGFTSYSHWPKPISTKIQSIYSYDACLNAIHKNAVKSILPYYDKDDSFNWWLSQMYFNHTTQILYPGQLIQFNDLLTTNKLSRPYPKSLEFNKYNHFFFSSIRKQYRSFFKEHPHFEALPLEHTKKEVSLFNIGELKERFDFKHSFWRYWLALKTSIVKRDNKKMFNKKSLYWERYHNKHGERKTQKKVAFYLLYHEKKKKRTEAMHRITKLNFYFMIGFFGKVIHSISPSLYRFLKKKVLRK